ncbi:HNH endonuclease [Sphingopyxis sp. 550A]
MKAVLDTKPESAYDDEIASRYHFPPRYLTLMRKCVGDWVVFRRPRAGGEGIAYFAVGRVIGIAPDPAIAGYHYASISDFLMFDRPVAWRIDGRYAEAALRAIENVPQVGLYLRGKSVRELEEADFAAIVDAGLSDTLDPANAKMLGLDATDIDTATWDVLHAPDAIERRTASILLNRKIRDASFRRAVCRAYGDRCAVSGIRIVNGGGRSEVQAAHILPVALGGPDVVQNGIALSATAHWLFDRHLISIGEDYRLLISHNKIPSELKALFAPQFDRVLLPADLRLWPRQSYLAAHRERFGGS